MVCDCIFVLSEFCSERYYVITHFLRMYECVSACIMYVVLQIWSLYPHTLMYSHGTETQWSLGRVTLVRVTLVTSLEGGGGHLGVKYDLWFKFLKKGYCIDKRWGIFVGESHMWPQQEWGQRSSRGYWPDDCKIRQNSWFKNLVVVIIKKLWLIYGEHSSRNVLHFLNTWKQPHDLQLINCQV